MLPDLTRVDTFIREALDGLALRQRVIGDNVANVDTPGFKAARVEFEAVLRDALARNQPVAATGEGLQPKVVTVDQRSGRSDGNNVDIDGEMINLAETNVTYNALAQLSAGRLRLLRSVISEGRR
jgi:flagellar basal-body rod protein FlgB